MTCGQDGPVVEKKTEKTSDRCKDGLYKDFEYEGTSEGTPSSCADCQGKMVITYYEYDPSAEGGSCDCTQLANYFKDLLTPDPNSTDAPTEMPDGCSEDCGVKKGDDGCCATADDEEAGDTDFDAEREGQDYTLSVGANGTVMVEECGTDVCLRPLPGTVKSVEGRSEGNGCKIDITITRYKRQDPCMDIPTWTKSMQACMRTASRQASKEDKTAAAAYIGCIKRCGPRGGAEDTPCFDACKETNPLPDGFKDCADCSKLKGRGETVDLTYTIDTSSENKTPDCKTYDPCEEGNTCMPPSE